MNQVQQHSEANTATLREQLWMTEGVATVETTRTGQMAKVFGYFKGLHATHLMELGRELGLFDRLAANPSGLQPDTLAALLALHPPYVRRWCETACALELLDYNPETGYCLAPFMDEILGTPDATYYLGGFPPVHLLIERDYDRYPELFRSGGTYRYAEYDEAFLRGVLLASATLPRMFVDAVLPNLPALHARLLSGARILDVGCGAGNAIVELAAQFPSLQCVGLDIDPVSVRLAQELIDRHDLADRVKVHLVQNEVWPEEFNTAFDLVTTFLVLHEIRPDLKDVVLGRSAAALKPDGQLLVFDERYPSRPSELRDPTATFAVIAQWFELTWGNEIDTREEILARLHRQGLRVSNETSLSRFYIVTAQKEQAA